MKSEILYGHRMQMYASEEDAKYWIPRAEWEDIRCYRRVEDDVDLRAQLAERDREIEGLREALGKFKPWGTNDCNNWNEGHGCDGRITLFYTDGLCLECQALKRDEESK